MWAFHSISDDFYTATRLFLKLELSPSRETLLHFFEQIRRAHPAMQRFRARENGAGLDEEAGEDGQRRYVRLDPRSLRFGFLNPPGREQVQSFGDLILTQAPPQLSLSPLDYDSLEVLYGFDLEYSGNHDELIAETLLADSPLAGALTGGDVRVIDCQPCLGFALTPDCATQVYLDVRGRSSMHELRTGQYEPQLISVYLTLRRSFRHTTPDNLVADFHELASLGETIAAGRVIPRVVRPLREAIATRR